jgi:hypothetical protein
VKALEFQVTLTPDEWKEYDTIFLTRGQRLGQRWFRRTLRTFFFTVLLAGGGGCVFWFISISAGDTQFMIKLGGSYLALLILTAVLYYVLFKATTRTVKLGFGFTDYGWRYAALPAKAAPPLREWSEITGWKESKRAFHLGYRGTDPVASSKGTLWNALTVTRPRASVSDTSPQHAMIPKRALNAQQQKEVRALLTYKLKPPEEEKDE